MENKAIFWFRRDLRLRDNRGLHEALRSGLEIVPIFIFDREILQRLPDRRDRRVGFIYGAIANLQKEIRAQGSELLVFFGSPLAVFQQLLRDYRPQGLFLNRDHDPYPRRRDAEVAELFSSRSLFVREYQDHFFFERDQVLTEKHQPYTVFTPYSRKWLRQLDQQPELLRVVPSEKKLSAFSKKITRKALPSLRDLGFASAEITGCSPILDKKILIAYEQARDQVSDERATTHLGLHLRFGTLGVREAIRFALPLSATWIRQIIWRDFFSQILFHFPRVVRNSFRPEYDQIQWCTDKEAFERWCHGQTGFPLVDAGMRQLRATGNMPNRVRMNAASFLCKDLLIHWSWGERYFASLLLDYELASNNGNWQWVAGTGCDAAPYFRVFNPELQRQKFDPDEQYIRQWIPEWGRSSYPRPMVDHKIASRQAIQAFSKI